MRVLAGVRRSRLFTISYPDSADSLIIWRPLAKIIRLNMGDRAWAKFQAQMKQKQVQKKTKADTGLGAGVWWPFFIELEIDSSLLLFSKQNKIFLL